MIEYIFVCPSTYCNPNPPNATVMWYIRPTQSDLPKLHEIEKQKTGFPVFCSNCETTYHIVGDSFDELKRVAQGNPPC